jgi:hypothetical protein
MRGMWNGPDRRSDGTRGQDKAAVAIQGAEGLDGDGAENGEQDGGVQAGGTAGSEVEEWQKHSRSGMG